MKEDPLNEYKFDENNDEYTKEEMEYLSQQAMESAKRHREKMLNFLNSKIK